MGKCYTLSFDSNYFTGGIDNSARTYNVDWTFLPLNKRFKVTFSYMSAAAATVSGLNNVMALLLNLGQTSNFYCTGTPGLQMSQYVGTLRITIGLSAAYAYYFADVTSNPPIYLEQRPAQNVLTVQLCDGLSLTTPFTTPVPEDYVLTLAFEEVEYD
jgi:hypothetical protein